MNIIKLFESVVDKKPDYTAIWLISLFLAKRFGMELMQKTYGLWQEKSKITAQAGAETIIKRDCKGKENGQKNGPTGSHRLQKTAWESASD